MATILILDDSVTNRSIYARLASLVEPGIVVETFGDPADALEWLAHNQVELVITDFKMPGMDGAAFTRALRATSAGGDLPILVVTAHDDRSFRLQALDAGATDFLQSPVDHFEFVTRARNLLALGRRTAAGAPPPTCGGGGTDLARILEAVPVLISATDAEGRYLYGNAAFAAHAGASPDEIPGQTAAALLGPAMEGRTRHAERAVFTSGEPTPAQREEWAGPAGARRVFLTTRAPVRDARGAVVAVVTTSLELPPGHQRDPEPGR